MKVNLKTSCTENKVEKHVFFLQGTAKNVRRFSVVHFCCLFHDKPRIKMCAFSAALLIKVCGVY